MGRGEKNPTYLAYIGVHLFRVCEGGHLRGRSFIPHTKSDFEMKKVQLDRVNDPVASTSMPPMPRKVV